MSEHDGTRSAAGPGPGVDREETASFVDQRFTEAMEAYLAELDAGRVVDHRLFAQRYPDIAQQLISCFESLDFV